MEEEAVWEGSAVPVLQKSGFSRSGPKPSAALESTLASRGGRGAKQQQQVQSKGGNDAVLTGDPAHLSRSPSSLQSEGLDPLEVAACAARQN